MGAGFLAAGCFILLPLSNLDSDQWSGDYLMKTILFSIALAVAGFSQTVSKTEINTAPTKDVVSLAISPDGQKIVFVAVSQGRQQLWLHRLASNQAQPLPGTEHVIDP